MRYTTTERRDGQDGQERHERQEGQVACGANTWGDITVDAQHGIVFFPTGSPTHDLYGADRAGNNLFGNCLLALDARTGKRLWHFQTVHHDLWDYDLTAAPKVLTVRDPLDRSRTIDIVAQAGKTGFLYVFERLTGTFMTPEIVGHFLAGVQFLLGDLESDTTPNPR
jgi:quinoprotein glucose dehydrogenase